MNKAKVAYQAMNVKNRAVLRGMLGVDAECAVKVMTESQLIYENLAHE